MSKKPGISLKVTRADAIGFVMIAAISAGAYFFQVQPLLMASDVQEEQKVELTALKDQLSKDKHEAQLLRTRLEAMKRTASQADLRLESSNQINSRLGKLAQLAISCGLQVDEMEPGKTVVTPQYETTAIRVSGQGGYPACTHFLAELHKQLPDTSVRAFEMGSGSALGTTGSFTFQLLWHTAAEVPTAKK